MKYYLHDTNAFNDEKVSELFIQFGYEGLGLFYTILERIAAQEKPIKTTVLKTQLKVGKRLEKCWQFIALLIYKTVHLLPRILAGSFQHFLRVFQIVFSFVAACKFYRLWCLLALAQIFG